MPKILETRYWRFYCGFTQTGYGSKGDSEWGHLRPDTESLDAKLDTLIKEASENGWEIKSVTPLTASYHYTASQFLVSMDRSNYGGYGVGYGAPYTEGLIVIGQRWVDVSDEEIAERDRIAESKAAEAAALALSRRQQARAAELAALEAEPVKKAGLLRDKWRFQGNDYPTEALALGAKASAISTLASRPV